MISQNRKLTGRAERSLYSPSSGSLGRFLISKLCTLTIKKRVSMNANKNYKCL